jgi:hypothetical protein
VPNQEFALPADIIGPFVFRGRTLSRMVKTESLGAIFLHELTPYSIPQHPLRRAGLFSSTGPLFANLASVGITRKFSKKHSELCAIKLA